MHVRRGWATPLLLLGVFVAVVVIVQVQPRSPAVYSGPPYTVVSGFVTEGPVCPAEVSPSLPSCSPLPVADATIVLSSGGHEVERTTSELDGHYLFMITAVTGTYALSALPVQGLRPPAPVTVRLALPIQIHRVDLQYDTGIR